MNAQSRVEAPLIMEARDHECDIQGVVNNAHYQHYFEHARHRFLLKNGIDFAALAKQGINLMVSRIEIDYVHPIVAHDRFYITLEVTALSRLRYQFVQTLYKVGTETPHAIAKTTVVTVDATHKPIRHSPLAALIN